jgi:predicted RND superfamily exporter protein
VSQRININYSIKLEALSGEANRLFSALLEEIATAADRYTAPAEILSVETLKEIEEMKSFVKDFNYRIADVEGIIKSYLRYISEESPPQFTDVESVYDKIDELTKKFGIEKNEHKVPD